MDATYPAGPTFSAGSNAENAVTNANDLSAYFASLETPVLAAPSFPSAFNSGAAFSDQIVAPTGQDYLVSTTTYSATVISGSPSFTLSVNSSGAVSATLPTVSSVTTYTIQYSATNSAAATTTGTTSFNITVNPPKPSITSGGTASGAVGVTYTAGSPLYTIVATNTPTGYSASGLPAGTSLSGAEVIGTPTTATSYTATVTATNVTGSTSKTVTFSIAKGSQTISVTGTPTVAVNTTGSIIASATSGLALTYTSSTPSTCTVNSSGVVAGLAAGTANCTINIDQGGDTNWNAAPQVPVTLSIGKGNQTINVTGSPAVVVGGSGSITASATSGLALSYNSSTPSTCSVNSSGVVSGLAAGTSNCTITIDQGGDANWNPAMQGTLTLSIGKGSQTITNLTVPTSVTVNSSGTLSATGGGGSQPVVFSSLTTSVCTVSGTNGTTVTGIAAGTCTVAANQAGDANYNAALQETQNFAVGLNPQAITFGVAPTMTFGSGTATVSATGGGSGNPVTFSVPLTTTICSVSGNVVTALAAGTCTVAADQAGNTAYAAAPEVTQDITISKANQTIAFSAPPTVVVGGTGAVSATGGGSGNAVVFTSQTASVCTVSGTNGATITGVTAGTCTIAANQAGNSNYNAAAQATLSFSIGKGNQTITFGALPVITYGSTGTLTATATSGGTVVLSSLTPSVCSVSGNVVSGLNAGTCTIAGNQSGDANYNPASQTTLSFGIGQMGQSITFGVAPTLVVGGSGTLSATGGASGNTVTFSSLSASTCSVSGTTVRGLAAGTCTVAANQASSANYSAAPQVTQNITVGKGSQTLTFGPAPSLAVGGTATISVTGGPSSSSVVLTSLTASICTVSGTSVTGVLAGTCTIAANQAADANYTAATQATLNITVVNLPPTVAAASMTTALNTTATLDLAPYVTGFGITGVSISAQPAHGTLSVSGTRVSYAPNKDYFGSDSFTYKAWGAGSLESTSAATVSITITGRPDPTHDARVTGLINVETSAVKRFGMAQVFNFQQRLESRHHAPYMPLAPGASGGDGGVPAPVAAQPQTGTGYFTSWQPGTTVSYANDPNTLLLAPGAPGNSAPSSQFGSLLTAVANALTTSTLNLGAISNAVAANGDDSFSRLDFWAAGNLRFGTRSQGGTDTQFTTDGVSVGVDKRLDRKLTVGMGMGYARDKSSIGTDGTNSTSSGNSVAAYASYQMDRGAFLDGLLGYGKVSFDTNRYVASVNDFARASRGGDQLFGSLSFGYEFRKDALLWSPYGRYDFSYDRLDAGTENGAGANALAYASQNMRSSHLSFGMRLQSAHQTSFGIMQPHVRFEYQHGFEATDQTSVAYADLPGVLYAVPGTSQNTNAVVLGLGSDFLMSDTLKGALDYQRLRSNGYENYQSINFRLTKTLDGKNDFGSWLEASEAASAEHTFGLTVAAGYAYDDNVSRASDAPDKLSDTLYSLTVSKSAPLPVSEHTRLMLNGFVNAEKYRTYTGLGHLSAGMQGEYMYRESGEFESPTFGVFLRYTEDQYESDLRDGWRRSTGVTLRKPLTDRINLFGAFAENVRRGKSEVFDTYGVSGRVNLDYALAQGETLYLTGEYQTGDIVSSGRPSLKFVDVSDVLVRDDAFGADGLYAYRMRGRADLFTLGYNHSFGPRDSADIAWRYVQATPDKTPAYSAPIRYLDNLLSITYLMAF